jgi:hypothetical protein
MTSQGSADGRFTRALAQRNLCGAEIAAKEMGGLSLIDALDYLAVLVELQPERAPAAAIRWHGRSPTPARMPPRGSTNRARARQTGLRACRTEARRKRGPEAPR